MESADEYAPPSSALSRTRWASSSTPAAAPPPVAGIAPRRAPGHASGTVRRANGVIAIRELPDPHALGSVTGHFGEPTPACAANMLAAWRRAPPRSGALAAGQAGL